MFSNSADVENKQDDTNLAELPPLPVAENPEILEAEQGSIESKGSFQQNSVTFEIPEEQESVDLTEQKTVIKTTTIENNENNEESGDNLGSLMDGDNPLLARVQATIFKQLNERHAVLEFETKEKVEFMRSAKKRREEVGVELYNLQQELAKIQKIIETTEQESIDIRLTREKLDMKLKNMNQGHIKTRQQYKEQQKKCDGQREELEKLSRDIKELELYKNELESKLKLAKRNILKSEQDAIKQDLEKRRQDFMIDTMTENLRRIQEKKALHEAQVLNQEMETKAIMEVIQDTTTEIEAIQLEKKELFQRWKSSILVLGKRDDIYNDVERATQLNKENIRGLDMRIQGFKFAMREINEETENLESILGKTRGEISYIQHQLELMGDKKAGIQAEYSKYSSLYDHNEAEITKQSKQIKQLLSEITVLEKNTAITEKASQSIGGKIADTLTDQVSFVKGNQNSKKDTEKIRAEIDEKETMIAQIENQVASTSLDSLSLKQTIEQSRVNIERIDKEYSKLNKTIEIREYEMKKMTEDVIKKQNEIALLDKKYDALNKSLNESSGPLELIIKNISREISNKEQESQNAQRSWLKFQAELLERTSKSSDIAEDIENNQMKLSVLKRKKLVLESQFDSENHELQEYQRNIRKIQKDIERICSMVAGHKTTRAKLEDNNFSLQQELRSNLKDIELETIRFESQIKAVQAEKEKALQGLIEAERQLMLWEKKIEMVKQTQATLDPKIGANEALEMQAEIHRMKLKYSALLRLQERMISEMERSVEKREIVTKKTKVKAKGSSQLVLERTISELIKKIKQVALDTQETESDIHNVFKAKDRVEAKMQESRSKCTEFEQRERLLHGKLEDLLNKKSLSLNSTLLFQKIQKRGSDIKAGKYVFLCKEQEQRLKEFEKWLNKMNKVHSMVKDIEAVSTDNTKPIIAPIAEFLRN